MPLRFNKNIQGTRDSDNYKTPKDFYDKLNEEFSFNFDPCPLKCNIADWDGLKRDWGRRVFVNPPYSNIEPWLKKGITEIKKGNSEVIVYLIPLRTDSWYWHHTILKFAKEVRLVRGRLNFGRKELAPFPVALIIFDKLLLGQKELISFEKVHKTKMERRNKIVRARRLRTSTRGVTTSVDIFCENGHRQHFQEPVICTKVGCFSREFEEAER